MYIRLITLQIQLYGCDTLKQKRSQLARIRDIYGRQAHIALQETGDFESLTHTEWSVVIAATDKQRLMQRVDAMLSDFEKNLDVQVLDIDQQML